MENHLQTVTIRYNSVTPSGACKTSQEAAWVDRQVQSAAGACDVIAETGVNAGSNRPGCSPGSPLQAEAAGIIREAPDFVT